MNKANMMQMKQQYEEALTNKLAELLGIDKKFITASWSIDAAKVFVKLESSEMVNSFNFTYKDENLFVDMESYKLLTSERNNGERYVSGVQAKSTSTDAKTLLTLAQAFAAILDAEEVNEPHAEPIGEEEIHSNSEPQEGIVSKE